MAKQPVDSDFKKPAPKAPKSTKKATQGKPLQIEGKKSALKLTKGEDTRLVDSEAPQDRSSEFSFDDSEASQETSLSTESSTELSSSATDEFASGALTISLDAKTTEKLHKEIQEKKKPISQITANEPRGVIYVGHIPYGFHEAQMRKFFSQFGIVTRLRMSRNKKTGKPKHYAFVEFLDPIVARIVADTMNGYIMYKKMLVCTVIPPEKVHPKMFKGAGKVYKPAPTRSIAISKHNKPMTEDRQKKIARKLKGKESKKRKRLEELGVQYDFPGYKAAADAIDNTPSTEEDSASKDGEADAPPTKKQKLDSQNNAKATAEKKQTSKQSNSAMDESEEKNETKEKQKKAKSDEKTSRKPEAKETTKTTETHNAGATKEDKRKSHKKPEKKKHK